MLRKEKKKHPLVNGKPIRFRFAQNLGWRVMAAALGVGCIAGIYWIFLQQHYPFLPGSGSLKLWWDNGMNGLIRSLQWPKYRHGLRDDGEPEAWALVGGVLLGSASVNARRIPVKLIPVAMLIMLCCILAIAVGITWVTDFGPFSNVSDIFSWQQIVLGFLAGQVLHLLWKPVGATIRYQVVSRSVRYNTIPLWVRLPLLPPAWREMWSELKQDTAGMPAKERTDRFRQSRVLIPLGILVFLAVSVTGLLAKYAVAHGVHIPGMN